MPKILCVIGTDGSGKTTVAEAVVDELVREGRKANRVWLGSDSYLMAPVRRVLKLLWDKRGANAPGGLAQVGSASRRVDYAAEVRRKNAIVSKYRWAISLYLLFVWLDYFIQISVKMILNRRHGYIIADRYYYDVAVNLGITLGWTPEQVVEHTRKVACFFPLPVTRIFLRVDAEVSMARKDDVYDIDYLRMRLSYYDAIANAFAFVEIDGRLPVVASVRSIVGVLHTAESMPYVMYIHSNNYDIGGADKVLASTVYHMASGGRSFKPVRACVVLRLPTLILDEYRSINAPCLVGRFIRPQLSRGVFGVLKVLILLPISLSFFVALFRRERPDVVHLNDLYDFIPALAAAFCGIPAVWHVRIIPRSEHLRTVFGFLLNLFSAKTIFISKAVSSAFPGVAAQKRACIYDFSNLELFGRATSLEPCISDRPKPFSGRGRLTLMVGRVEPWKGQALFLDAVAQLDPKVRNSHEFGLVGGPVPGKEEYYVEIASRAADLGVLMLGHRNDVPDLLRFTDIMVHCSITPEPLGAVVLEGMLAGTLTIAAAAGGVVEIIENANQGVLVPPGDAVTLSATLDKYVTSTEAPRTKFGKQARARVIELVDPEKIGQQTRSLYSEVSGK